MPDPGRADDPGRILVIRLGALGDFLLSLGPMAAIREAHPNARITLLTTRPYARIGRDCGLFDDIMLDERPKLHDIRGILALRRRLRDGGFSFVYDLQTSDRSGFYFRLFGRARRPGWSGIVAAGSHPHRNPRRTRMHTIERQADQLREAGLAEVPLSDLSFLQGDVSGLVPEGPLALLLPGGAPHRPDKRWPAANYAEIACRLSARGITPVLIGTDAEREVIAQVTAACPAALSLMNRTDFGQIATLARRAVLALGNDTGPMHLVTLAGGRALVLFSSSSDPALCGQRGAAVRHLSAPRLENLPPAAVWEALIAANGAGDGPPLPPTPAPSSPAACAGRSA